MRQVFSFSYGFTDEFNGDDLDDRVQFQGTVHITGLDSRS